MIDEAQYKALPESDKRMLKSYRGQQFKMLLERGTGFFMHDYAMLQFMRFAEKEVAELTRRLSP